MRNIKIVAVAIVCIVFFVLGTKIADLDKNATVDEYTKLSEYDNITIFSHDGYNKTYAELYLNDLTALPKGLTENCENIYFTNENLNEKFDLGLKTKIVALTLGKDIYISTDYHDIDVLVHELYHVYDYANGWISDTDEFIELYEIYKDDYEVSPGNNENVYEFFATYGENFYLRKNELNDDALFAFFERLNIR